MKYHGNIWRIWRGVLRSSVERGRGRHSLCTVQLRWMHTAEASICARPDWKCITSVSACLHLEAAELHLAVFQSNVDLALIPRPPIPDPNPRRRSCPAQPTHPPTTVTPTPNPPAQLPGAPTSHAQSHPRFASHHKPRLREPSPLTRARASPRRRPDRVRPRRQVDHRQHRQREPRVHHRGFGRAAVRGQGDHGRGPQAEA